MASSVTRYTNRCSWLTRARPAACQDIFERLRLSQSLERISHDCVHQIQHSDCGAVFGFDPRTKVLPELRLKDENRPV